MYFRFRIIYKMSSSWDVVIFKKDNSCTYVPTSWAVNKEKTVYLWPKMTSKIQLKKMQQKCSAPSAKVTYQELEATCKATVCDLSQAIKYSEKLIYSSSLSDCNGNI